jgi:DNA-binding response OmpR family regulator
MATTGILLCIHRDPAQLSVLHESGYELLTATNGRDGLRLVMSRIVDAIVLEYHLGLLDGLVVAAEIKQVQPKLPIVMVADNVELPDGGLKAVDAFVAKSDGPQFLLATVRSVLNPKLEQPAPLPLPERSKADLRSGPADASQLAIPERDVPFSPRVWRGIQNGRLRF